MSKPAGSMSGPDWERVLSAAARLQQLLPEAVLVGGTAAGLHAGHRVSRDADHVPTDLRSHFDEVLGQLESVAGWNTARVNRPVLILGSLDGIETGVRQLIRTGTASDDDRFGRRPRAQHPNRSRDPPHQRLSHPPAKCHARLRGFRGPGPSARRTVDRRRLRALRPALPAGQWRIRPPADAGPSSRARYPTIWEGTVLSEYNHLEARWHDWEAIRAVCTRAATVIFEHGCEQ